MIHQIPGLTVVKQAAEASKAFLSDQLQTATESAVKATMAPNKPAKFHT